MDQSKSTKPTFDERISCLEEFRLSVLAAMEAHHFEVENFTNVRAFDNQEILLRYTLERVDSALNTWVELGVSTGRSTRLIVQTAAELGHSSQLHAFDSFEGLPEDFIAGVEKGAFATKPPVFEEENIHLHVGWFIDTLPPFAASLNQQIGFIHCDADLYSSTRTALNALKTHIGPGTVLLFDEYWNFLGCYEHEFRAFMEFIEASELQFRYLGYNKNYTQASVLLLER